MIERELVAVLNQSAGDSSPVFAEQAEEELARRQEQVARRELDATAVEERLRAWNEHLRRWEAELTAKLIAARSWISLIAGQHGCVRQVAQDRATSVAGVCLFGL